MKGKFLVTTTSPNVSKTALKTRSAFKSRLGKRWSLKASHPTCHGLTMTNQSNGCSPTSFIQRHFVIRDPTPTRIKLFSTGTLRFPGKTTRPLEIVHSPNPLPPMTEEPLTLSVTLAWITYKTFRFSRDGTYSP